MSNTYRITSKGQVTIPQEIRESLSLFPHTEVVFDIKNGFAVIRKADSKKKGTLSRGEDLVRTMRGTATVKMSTDEILALTRK